MQCVCLSYGAVSLGGQETDVLVESNLEKWLRAMDFSRIEDIYLAQEDNIFYERMGNELPSLKRLTLEWANSGLNVPEERVNFIKSLPPLESLSINIEAPYYFDDGLKNRTHYPIQAIIDTHCQSLQSLGLNQEESMEMNLRRPMLTNEEINELASSCPHLQHISLDIDRDFSRGWPNATFDALTEISSLDSLTLNLELGADLHAFKEPGTYGWNPGGLDGPDAWFREPRMSLEVAEALFRDLCRKKAGSELKTVEFVVGEVQNKPYSGPLYFPLWQEGRARVFVCEQSPGNGPFCSIRERPRLDEFDDLDQ